MRKLEALGKGSFLGGGGEGSRVTAGPGAGCLPGIALGDGGKGAFSASLATFSEGTGLLPMSCLTKSRGSIGLPAWPISTFLRKRQCFRRAGGRHTDPRLCCLSPHAPLSHLSHPWLSPEMAVSVTCSDVNLINTLTEAEISLTAFAGNTGSRRGHVSESSSQPLSIHKNR